MSEFAGLLGYAIGLLSGIVLTLIFIAAGLLRQR